jgi:3-phosphoshikimate 1-carboxyvinyltransferase
VGTVHVRGNKNPKLGDDVVPNAIRRELIPQLIDELPLLAVVGSQISGGIEIRDAAELRVKEADRIRATVVNLRAMGAEVEEYEDGLRVAGPTRLQGAHIDSFGDHRIAMAFAIAALLADGESEIAGADCVAISFPEFFDLLESITQRT